MNEKVLKSIFLLLVLCGAQFSYAQETQASGNINGHGYVDLGLNVMWATCNVGANTPEEYGDYFAWGETRPKAVYTDDNSITYKKELRDFAGNRNYDAATANWGGTWRLPTKDDIDELLLNCTSKWITRNGVNGRLFTSKKNGKSIFLPAGGMYGGSSFPWHVGDYGNYMCSTPTANTWFSYALFAGEKRVVNDGNYRYTGISVRPVSGPISKKTTKPQNEKLSTPNGTDNGHEYVDLGLSVKWATCNVGASTPGDYGDYFAWGETKTKSTYTERNCATNKKSIEDIAGDSNYDVARANWGGTWRMPTWEELQELINHCTTEWTTSNGIKGYLVTSKINGNSIFLPAAESCHMASFPSGQLDKYGSYWSSSSTENGTKDAYGLYFKLGGFNWNFGSRSVGRSVRPVTDGRTTPKEIKIISSSELSTPSGTINGYEYVDLGLSIKWATCNVGASSPQEYGDYYAWGATSTKPPYTAENCTTWEQFLGDIAGDSNYDVARANWGGTWRMPAKEEIEELINNCTTEWAILDGVNGRLVTSKKNGNSIFLPAAGYYGSSLGRTKKYGSYWSSSPSEDDTQGAYRLDFDRADFAYFWSRRYLGRCVRPVSDGSTIPKGATSISSSELNAPNGTINGYEYVDLGLSVKWATCNVGASSPQEYGDYYAWGDKKTKSEYTQKNCSTKGKKLGDIAGNRKYDIARANWGGTWRMPTKEEIEELIDNCNIKWITCNGIKGYLATSKKNGNSIFLPAAGYREGLSLFRDREACFYWSSSPYGPQSAYYLYFRNGDKYKTTWNVRDEGLSVRPVTE